MQQEMRFGTNDGLSLTRREPTLDVLVLHFFTIRRFESNKLAPEPIEEKLSQKMLGPGGLTGLGLEHFAELDRLEAMTRFLSLPHVFENVGLSSLTAKMLETF